MDSNLKSLRSELKLNATQMKGAGESAELLKNRQKMLKTELASAREKTVLLSGKLTEAQKIFGNNSAEVQRLSRELTEAKNVESAIKNEINQTNAKIKDQAQANSQLEQSVTKSNSSIKQLDQELTLNATKLEGASNKTDLLKQRQAMLENQSQASSDKVKNLENALEACAREVGENSDEYVTLKERLTEAKTEQAAIQNEIKNTTKELQAQKTQVQLAGEAIGKFGDNVNSIADKTRGISTAAAGVLTAVGASAITFESAFAGVTKTTDEVYDANGKCVYSYKQLEDGIRKMAKEIPASTTEISAVAEAAGQLGIKTEDVLGFTRVMIDMGQSTNLSSDEAATSIAKFANVTGLAADQSMSAEEKYKRVGSTIVDLGNNYATTEADIMAMAQNLASAGTQVGMSESDILALATSLSSVGMEAQAGGTAFSRAIVDMQLAVETNSESLNDWAKVAGMSADEFATKFKTDATGALEAFIQGLSKCGGETDSAIKVLDNMGITETRMRDALLRSANASDVFTSAIQTGRGAWEENTALTKEAEKRYETTASQLQIMKNHVVDTGITLGSIFLPAVTKITGKVSEFADKVAGLDKDTQKTILGIVAFTALLFPLLKGISGISKGISGVIGIGSKLSGMFSGAAVAAQGAGGAATAAMSAPILPILGIVAGIGAVVGVFVLLWNKSESFRDFFTGIWEGLKNTVDGFLKKINFGDKIDGIKEKFSGLGEKLKGLENVFKIIGTVASVLIVPALGALAGAFNAVLSAIEPIITIIGGLIDTLSGIGDMIVGVFTGDLDLAKQGAEKFISGIGSAFGGLWDLVVGVLDGFVEGIFSFFTSLLDVCGITDFVQSVWEKFKVMVEKVSSVFTTIGDAIRDTFQSMVDIVSNIFNTIGSVVQVGIAFIAEILSFAWQVITIPFRFIWENCKGIVISAWEIIKSHIQSAVESVKNVVNAGFELVKTYIINPIQNAYSTVSTIFQNIYATILAKIDAAKASVSKIFESIRSVISDKINAARAVVASIFEAIRTHIVNPINQAYLTATGVFQNIYSVISSKVNAALSVVSTVFESVRAKIVDPISRAYGNVNEIFSNIYSTISSKINAAKDVVRRAVDLIKGAFDFSWSLPELKLPHISVNGGKAPFGIGGKGSLPSFSIEWYKHGKIFTKPTLFSTPFGLKGVGEAGAEAVLPISNLVTYVEDSMNRVIDARMQRREAIDYDRLAEAMSKHKTTLQVGRRELGRIMREST